MRVVVVILVVIVLNCGQRAVRRGGDGERRAKERRERECGLGMRMRMSIEKHQRSVDTRRFEAAVGLCQSKCFCLTLLFSYSIPFSNRPAAWYTGS